MSNCSKIGGVDPRLISHRHHLDKFTLKGNFKIEPGFGVAHLQFQKITYLWCGGSVRGRDKRHGELAEGFACTRRPVAVVRLRVMKEFTQG